MKDTKKIVYIVIAAIALLALPLLLQSQGNAWVRIADIALLYVLLALGLNIVVGYAGLLDLGYVAFFAIGAYLFALLGSPHLTDTFPAMKAMFPNGLHSSLLLVIPAAFGLAALFGVLLGAPTLKLRGDYLAIVTLGFGEIIRVFLNNLDHPFNPRTAPRALPPSTPCISGASTWADRSSSATTRSPRSRCTTTCSSHWSSSPS
jgi:branched-chain amino acid transport system permease protein